MLRVGVAWCPGGRTRPSAVRSWPSITASTALTQAPAADTATAIDAGETTVSASMRPPPASMARFRVSTTPGECTRVTCSNVTGLMTPGVQRPGSPARSSRSLTATNRCGRSGCWPVSC